MTVRDIAEKACEIIGLTVNFNLSGTEQTLLVNCTQNVLLRLSGELCEIKKQKTITVRNGIALYEDIDADYKKGIRLVSNGKSVKFNETDLGIVTDKDGEYKLTYSVYIKAQSLNSEVNLQPKFGLLFLAEGVVGEYYNRKGLYKECELYDNRFAAALKNIESPSKSYTVKAVEYDI